MKIKKNDILDLEIIDITNLGFGVAKPDGAVIFISGALPGDRVKARIIKVQSSYYVARVEEFISKSQMRDDERCKSLRCRSCAYIALRYEEELRKKHEFVETAFRKAGLKELEISEVFPSPSTRAYRNKAQYPIRRLKNGEYAVGFFAPKTHNICEARDCALTPEIFKDILNLITDELQANDISTYDEESGLGLMRHIYLRRAETTGEILLTFVINGDTIPGIKGIVSRLVEKFPEIVGIMQNENRECTNIILGEKWTTLFGRDYITDTLCDVKLKITAPSFYQVNRRVAEEIYREAKRLASPKSTDTLLDLYCGAGSIGLSMARDAARLIGIEIIPDAVRCAAYNAEVNGIANARFFTGDAKDTEGLLSVAERELNEKIKPDIVVLDPPRAGCAPELIDYISGLNPSRIIYISCNPTTLARDMVHFGKHGYNASSVKPFDMFPGTGHVECVTCITKAK